MLMLLSVRVCVCWCARVGGVMGNAREGGGEGEGSDSVRYREVIVSQRVPPPAAQTHNACVCVCEARCSSVLAALCAFVRACVCIGFLGDGVSLHFTLSLVSEDNAK